MDIQVILCVYEKMFLISADTMTKGRLARRQAKEQLLHNTLSRYGTVHLGTGPHYEILLAK